MSSLDQASEHHQPPPHHRRRAFLGGAAAGVLLAACAGGGSGGSATPLVFGSDGNIAVLSLDGRRRQALTRYSGGALARDPAWSPDGQRIAYSYTPSMTATRGPGGMLPLPVTDVYVMQADGSDAKVLIPHGAPGIGFETPTWAPDAQSLFVTYTELVMEGNVVRDQIVELARLPIGGGERQTLVRNAIWPTVSADGARLASVASHMDGQALQVADVDGKNVRTVVPKGSMDGLASPRFSPDGRRIAFSAVSPMAPVPVPTSPPAGPARPPAASTAAPPPRSGADAGPGSLAAAAAGLRALLPSPRRVQAHGLPMDVYVVDLDGTPPRRLTELGEDNPAPVWSPDGKGLVILAGGGIYTVNADGSSVTAITDKGGHGTIDWKRR
jgi:Tol biopolymer transport system component